MNTFMSIDEVFASYPGQWVLLDELESKDNLTVEGGRVVACHPEREGVALQAIEMRLTRCVIVCALRDENGEPAVQRDYAVSPITSFDEIQQVLAEYGG